MAHVTLFRYKALPGKRQELLALMDQWERERKPKVKGFQRSIMVSNLKDPDEFFSAVRFDTTENYNANSNDPEQDAWSRKMRALCLADPVWFDGKLEKETLP